MQNALRTAHLTVVLIVAAWLSHVAVAADFPSAEISNGQIKAKI